MKPAVTVIVPMRNSEPYTRAMLDSLHAQMTSIDFEIVIVNDGSTDGCDRVVREHGSTRVRLVEGGGRGEANAVNLAVENARGAVIMRCDADDLWPNDRLDWQARWLDEHPEFAAVGGTMWSTDPGGSLRVPMGDGGDAQEITEELLQGRTRTSLCTFAVRRESFVRAGGCRPYFLTSPDIDLQFRLAEVGRIWFEPRRCYVYRLHGASITHQQSNARREFFERTAIEFARQRRERSEDDLMRNQPPEIPAEFGAAADPRRKLLDHLGGACWRAHSEGRRGEALKLGWQACQASGWSRQYLWNLVALSFKRPGGRARSTP